MFFLYKNTQPLDVDFKIIIDTNGCHGFFRTTLIISIKETGNRYLKLICICCKNENLVQKMKLTQESIQMPLFTRELLFFKGDLSALIPWC